MYVIGPACVMLYPLLRSGLCPFSCRVMYFLKSPVLNVVNNLKYIKLPQLIKLVISNKILNVQYVWCFLKNPVLNPVNNFKYIERHQLI